MPILLIAYRTNSAITNMAVTVAAKGIKRARSTAKSDSSSESD